MDKKRGKLFVFSAPSGAGKTTIVRHVLKNHPELIFSISATTRDRRKNEVDGKDYFFINEEDFKKKIKSGEFIEWEKFYDYYYGTLRNFVEEKLNEGFSIVLEVDVKGALNIKNSYPGSVLIFIKPPSLEELKKRLINRNTETETDLRKRIERAEMELSYQEHFDYSINNENLQKAKAEAEKIIKEELNKGERSNGNYTIRSS